MAELLKDLYNEKYVALLADAVASQYPAFDREAFNCDIFDIAWDSLELKRRMRRITESLRRRMPDDYREALRLLEQAVAGLEGYGLQNLIFPDFVEQYGLDDWDASLPALKLFTPYSTSEYAVRPFILADAPRMMARMLEWASDDNHHVRRLASEGCRPRLPWGIALAPFKQDPSPVLPILERLKADESEYVRKSVANNLNDIAKDHPELVLDLAQRWFGRHPHTDWIVRHGCRTLLKRGQPQALALFGFDQELAVSVEGLALSPSSTTIGGTVTFGFTLLPEGDAPAKIRVEYAIDFVKSGGKRSRKIFKITENTYNPGVAQSFSRTHSLADLSTRRHYPGVHRLAVVINGVEAAAAEFELLHG